jgi:hypothetical protein
VYRRVVDPFPMPYILLQLNWSEVSGLPGEVQRHVRGREEQRELRRARCAATSRAESRDGPGAGTGSRVGGPSLEALPRCPLLCSVASRASGWRWERRRAGEDLDRRYPSSPRCERRRPSPGGHRRSPLDVHLSAEQADYQVGGVGAVEAACRPTPVGVPANDPLGRPGNAWSGLTHHRLARPSRTLAGHQPIPWRRVGRSTDAASS